MRTKSGQRGPDISITQYRGIGAKCVIPDTMEIALDFRDTDSEYPLASPSNGGTAHNSRGTFCSADYFHQRRK